MRLLKPAFVLVGALVLIGLLAIGGRGWARDDDERGDAQSKNMRLVGFSDPATAFRYKRKNLVRLNHSLRTRKRMLAIWKSDQQGDMNELPIQRFIARAETAVLAEGITAGRCYD